MMPFGVLFLFLLLLLPLLLLLLLLLLHLLLLLLLLLLSSHAFSKQSLLTIPKRQCNAGNETTQLKAGNAVR